MHTVIHTSSEIRTHDPSVLEGEDGSCLRPRGHCDRPLLLFTSIKLHVFKIFFSRYSCILSRTIEKKINEYKWSLELRFMSRLVAGENRSSLSGKSIWVHCYFVARQRFNSSIIRSAVSWLYISEQWSTITYAMMRLSLQVRHFSTVDCTTIS
jgi:hypothetical protein